MIDIIREAGFNGPLCVLLTVAGVLSCVVAARRGRPAGTCAMVFALVLLGFGLLGQALGQEMVNRTISANMMELDTRKLVEMVSIGTMEASRNLLLGGVGALLVLATGGGLSLASRRRG